MEAIGFLQVAAKTANGALPIENALVSIYEYSPEEENAPNSTLIYSLLTDENGRTQKVALKAKDKALSTVPGNKNPFAVYNVVVTKEGYYDSSFVNVPIFQGITALQPVEMIPLMEFSRSDDDFPSSTKRFNETPNTNL